MDDTTQALSRGTNQAGVRLYNERLVLSLIRRHASLTKAEIARLTGLSPQTTTVIINRLEVDGLVLPGKRQRGRVGQPSVPYALNPDGALSLGMMIGRRSCELVLMDFTAGLRRRIRTTYAYPLPEGLLDFAVKGLEELAHGLDEEQLERITGLGIAMPYELWNWQPELGAPAGALSAWRDFDIRQALQRRCRWPIQVCNDATAACAAELTFGRGGRYQDFAYLHIGAFIGGGIVLQGNLFPGRTGNAGALGSMPVMRRQDSKAATVEQLIRCASIFVLERKLIVAGKPAAKIWLSPDDWSSFGETLQEWIDESAEALAQAIVAAISVIDFEAIVIDGAFPSEVREKLVFRTRERVARLDRQGLSPAEIVEGSIGRDARAIGGAALPLLANYARDREVLFKEEAR